MSLRGLSRESLLRLGTIGLLVFAQSIPEKFIGNALPLIYRSMGMELSDFWIFSVPMIPRWMKWLIAPYLDRKPLLNIGLRRSWILVLTPLTALAYAAMAFANPSLENLYLVIFILFWAEMLTAMQDIPVDAYCIEALGPDEYALSGTVLNLASVFGFILVSAVLMVLYDKAGWTIAVLTMAALYVACTLPALLRPEPISAKLREEIICHVGRPTFRRAFMRENALPFFALVGAAGIYTSFASGLSHTMLLEKGLTISEIGVASGIGISTGIILGTLVSGWLLLRYSLKTVCLIACVPLAVAHGLEIGMALSVTVSMMAFLVVSFLIEIAVAPHYVLMSTARFGWTTKRQAGTDFTIQSSLRAVCLTLGGAISGPVAQVTGWPLFFACSMVLGLGSTLLMYVIHDRMQATKMRELHEDGIAERTDASHEQARDGNDPAAASR